MATVVSVSQYCVECESCSEFCPEVFEFVHGELHVNNANVSEKNIDDVEYCADLCPANAIIISVE